MKIYMLEHKKEAEGAAVLSSRIGVYRSKEKAQSTIESYRTLEGYKDYPDDFRITEFCMADDAAQAFVLDHEYFDGEYDCVTFLGVFSSQAEAQAAQAAALQEAPFIQHPDGFTIDAYALDQNHWTEGFFVY